MSEDAGDVGIGPGFLCPGQEARSQLHRAIRFGVNQDQYQGTRTTGDVRPELDPDRFDSLLQSFLGQQCALGPAEGAEYLDIITSEKLVPDAPEEDANRFIFSLTFDDDPDPKWHAQELRPPDRSSAWRRRSASSRSRRSCRWSSAREYSSFLRISRLAASTGVICVCPSRFFTMSTCDASRDLSARMSALCVVSRT